MSILEVANKYVELCKQRQFDTVIETLFAPDVVSVEAASTPDFAAEERGIQAVIAKGKRWAESNEVHNVTVDGPWPNGNRFIVRFGFDLTNKTSGQRIQMEEAGLFTVENGKIVREEFFYSLGG